MDATEYKFETHLWPPPDDRRDRKFYLFGFDADGQPYIVKWRHGGHPCWLAASLDDEDVGGSAGAGPIVHALVGSNTNKIARWADAPLRWSTLGLSPHTEQSKDYT